MKKLSLSKLQDLFAALSKTGTLYIPVDDASGQAKFTPWQEGMTLTGNLNTVRSAKDLFFPQVENMVDFKVEGKTIEIDENGVKKTYPLIGVSVNLVDYNVGTNGGAKTDFFDDFDIDFNKYKYLMETRLSGALTKPFAAIVLEEPVVEG